MIKKIISKLILIVTIIIFALSFYILVFGSIKAKNNELLTLFGYSYGLVPTDSMEGEKPDEASISGFKKGTVILIKNNDFNDLEVNDIVVYKNENNYLIVHRIIEKLEIDGEIKFVTKGDNPSAPVDSEYVTSDNYRGEVFKAIRFINIGFFVSNYRSTILGVLAIGILGLLVYQVFNITKQLNQKDEVTDEEIKELAKKKMEEGSNDEKWTT